MRDCKHLTFTQMEIIIHTCDEREKHYQKQITQLKSLIKDLTRQRDLYRDNLQAAMSDQTKEIKALREQVSTIALHTYVPVDIKG